MVPSPPFNCNLLLDLSVAEYVVILEVFTVAMSESNTTLPPVISIFGEVLVDSKPSSMALNGGEVSVGGQQSCLSAPELVAVKLAPATMFLVVA